MVHSPQIPPYYGIVKLSIVRYVMKIVGDRPPSGYDLFLIRLSVKSKIDSYIYMD